MNEEDFMEETMSAKSVFNRMGIALNVVLIVASVAQIICLSIGQVVVGVDVELPSYLTMVLTFAPIYCIAMPIGIAMIKKIPSQMASESSLGIGDFIKYQIICIPIMYIGNIIGTFLSYVLSSGTATNALESILSADNMAINIFFVVILAPIFEELIFRKLLIDRCSKYGEKTAIIFSALMFGLFHGNLFQFFYAFGIGLILAYVYTHTRKLRYPILMHMIINFWGSVPGVMLLSQLDEEVLNQVMMGTADEATILSIAPAILGLLAMLLVNVILSIVGIVLIFKNKRKITFAPASEELEKGQIFRTVYCNAGVILLVVLCIGLTVFSLLA